LRTRERYTLSRGKEHHFGNGFGPWGNFPAELDVLRVEDISARASKKLEDLETIPFCQVLGDLLGYRDKWIAMWEHAKG
jgi:hypothetical protein